ncbi:MAG: zinc metallopeptidase [Verrucomicrobiae bacterium]|nr:zinc metallopeptidase [Verrucomicrobiae bacterium]
MRWEGRRQSENVEDRRGQGGGRGGLVLGGGLGTLILIVVVMLLGGDPRQFLDMAGQAQAPAEQYQPTQEDEQAAAFVKTILADTEDVWHEEFRRMGREYVEPKLVLFTESVRSGCGFASSQVGPFYCPADQTVYVDLSFFNEMKRRFGAPGDFAQAYVVAHEVGHHVQKLLGTSDKVARMQGQPDYNEYSVRLELQADYYAGVWANHSRQYLERGDIEEAMRAANAIGDDAIQKQMQGRVVPHSFTHGTSEQRMRWFNRGLESGRLEDGDTFSMPYENL